MVIEGVRGSGIEGDIAIDDVAIEEGECKDPPPNSEYALDEKLLFDSWLLQTHTQFLSETSRTCFEYFLFLSSVNMKDAQSLRTIASFLNLSLFHWPKMAQSVDSDFYSMYRPSEATTWWNRCERIVVL